MLLANLLPGLRDLRTPLAAGYLWLATIWVSVGDTLPTRRQAKGSFIGRLYGAYTFFGVTGALALLSFIAFLLGSILTISPSFLLHILGLKEMSARSGKDLNNYAFRRAKHLGKDDSVVRGSMGYGMIDRAWGTFASLPQLIPRLQAASQDLFNSYDRLHAEAEFRLTVSPAIAGLAIALSIKWTAWAALSLVIPLALALLGIAKERAANDVVIEALCIDVISSTSLDEELTKETRPYSSPGGEYWLPPPPLASPNDDARDPTTGQ